MVRTRFARLYITNLPLCLVPVLDGRNTTLRLPDNFDAIRSLKTFPGQIPEGSVVSVAYTTYKFMKVREFRDTEQNIHMKNMPHIGHNILFVVVLAVPLT